jgi:oligoendopeptidase F
MNAPLAAPAGALPVWSLDDLYAGREDPRIDRDLAAAAGLAADLRRLAEGRLTAASAEPARLGALIEAAVALSERIADLLWPIGAYAALAASTARDDPASARFEADIQARIAQVSAESLFLSLELNALDDEAVAAALAAVPAAARWRPWIRRARLRRPHQLSPDMERLLADRAPAVDNWVRLYDDVLGRLAPRAGDERLTLPETLNRLSDPSPVRRAEAAEGLAVALGERRDVLALCLNTLALEKAVEDRWRRHPTPATARHLANEIEADAVAAMEAAVVEAYAPLSHRYYRLKAQVMGKARLDHWDRNAPLSSEARSPIPWAQAEAIVRGAFAELSPELGARAAVVFDHPWIDARPRPGKQSGAYSHPVTAPRHPYVLLNYMGERRDVLTLAHEVGHAVHQALAAPNGTLLAATPLTLAETASIFAEGLAFERLLAAAADADRLAFLASGIEDALNSVVRQIAFHRFETRFHAARAGGEVSPDAIGAIFRDVMAESLGPAVALGDGYETYWAYVTHFVHAPFYVYAYAFGRLLVEALMTVRRRDPEAFAPLYLALLAGGGARTYVEALAPFGLDPREASFWRLGLSRLEALVDQFEAQIRRP